MNKAKLRIWWNENWLKYLGIGLLIVIGVMTIAGTYVFLFKLESFQKQTLVASGPIYLLHSLVAAIALA